MENKKFQALSWIIVVAITLTVLAQAYWNWRNYQENKRFLISEMQVALDNAVEQYFAVLAKVHFVQMRNGSISGQKIIHAFSDFDTLNWTVESGFQISGHNEKINADTITRDSTKTNLVIVSKFNTTDSLTPIREEKRFMKLASKLAMSLAADSLNLRKLDSLVVVELERKGIEEEFELLSEIPIELSSNLISIPANPTYLTPGTELFLSTTPSFGAVLKKGISGVIISLLTALVIISVLIYLYRFIQHQKSLDRMKNDLISNITHEFKTPIATVSTALEAIEKFNTEKDVEKTAKYLKLSNEQLTKLNDMVEKLLDTATMEEGDLILNPEKTNLTQLVQEVIESYTNTQDKTITFHEASELWTAVDRFHFEHVISNLIDNAIKYGGDQIHVALTKNANHINLSVSDNGKGIEKKEQTRIFDKFYRISSGNVHDVKGYGIGLYYARSIVEKHGGQLALTTKDGNTSFNIILHT